MNEDLRAVCCISENSIAYFYGVVLPAWIEFGMHWNMSDISIFLNYDVGIVFLHKPSDSLFDFHNVRRE